MEMNLVGVCLLLLKCISIEARASRLDGRIVGGRNASILEFPYQVSVRKFLSHICGGTIFHNSYILTAAHCIVNGSASSFSIRAGSVKVNNGGTIIKVCSMQAHENYNDHTMENDIAILRLCTPLNFSNAILPIALPEASETVTEGTIALISGWGYTQEEGKVSLELQQVSLPIISNKKCNMMYAQEEVSTNMICAGVAGIGGKDACQGDSGGPLRANGKLLGIVSWGYGCARPQYPGVYTKVSNYRKWIRTITKY